MFNVTGGEVVMLMVIALVVLGPDKLPEMLRKVGRIYGEVRRMANGFQSEFREAFEEPIREFREAAESAFQLPDDEDPTTVPEPTPPAREPFVSYVLEPEPSPTPGWDPPNPAEQSNPWAGQV